MKWSYYRIKSKILDYTNESIIDLIAVQLGCDEEDVEWVKEVEE